MPKLVDTQARRRLVAEATLALIRQWGPAAVTQRGVAREAGIGLSCNTGDQIGWTRASHVIAETLGLLAQHLMSPAEGRPGYHG